MMRQYIFFGEAFDMYASRDRVLLDDDVLL
jgi:hypothetical protein